MFISLQVSIYYPINIPGLTNTISIVLCIQYTLLLYISYAHVGTARPAFYAQLNKKYTTTKKSVLVTKKSVD